MFYSPKNNKKGAVTSAALLAICAVLNVISPAFEGYSGAVAAVSVLFLASSLYVLIRFCVGRYSYEITRETFVITKTTGQKSVTVANMLLSTAYGVSKYPKSGAERAAFDEKYGMIDAKMNCCHNLFAKTHLYVTEFNGKTYCFEIEIDDEFAASLSAAVSDARRRAGENDL